MSEAIYVFAAEPRIGTELTYDGQSYTLIALEPHRRQDGHSSVLLVWQTECAKCQAPFDCRSSVAVRSLNRRCDKHRRPGSRPGGKRRRSPPRVTVRLP
jgi:hypothetical protein